MKKFLLSCFLALGIAGTAQTTLLDENFTYANGVGSVPNWTVGNVGTLGFYGYNTFGIQAGCANNNISGGTLQVLGYPSASGASCNYTSVNAANTGFGALVHRQVDAAAYNNLKLSYKWKCGGEVDKDYGILVYSLDNGATWVQIGTNKLQGQTTVQTVTDLALPAALNNKVFRLGWIFYADAATVTAPGLAIDDVKLVGEAPATCTGAPAAGTASLSFNIGNSGSVITGSASGISAGGGISYQWQISTNNGTSWSDVAGATTASSSITIPAGNMGDILLYRLKVACSDSGQESFSNALSYKLDYCTLTADAGVNKFPISSVKIGSVEKVSDINPGPTVPAIEYFTAETTNFNVYQDTAATMEVKVFASTAYRMGVTYFIDWNHDGDFNDAGESYNITAPLLGTGTTANNYPTVTANFTVPVDAALGKTRMRVKTNYYADATFLGYLNTPCGNVANGQAEDHILDVKDKTLAVSDVSKASISVYPNPFTDVLKISDVKGVKSISVNDISGREVKSLAPSAELNLSSLKTGLYIVNLKMEDGSVKTFKAIKK